MVEYVDGSVLAQLGQPDMRTPIAHAMAWPKRIDSGVERLNLIDVARLEFEKPDPQRFPCLRLAEQAARAGGTTPAILNAANEIAVAEFLNNKIRFTDIAPLVEDVMTQISTMAANDLDTILQADREAREHARRWIDRKQQQVNA